MSKAPAQSGPSQAAGKPASESPQETVAANEEPQMHWLEQAGDITMAVPGLTYTD